MESPIDPPTGNQIPNQNPVPNEKGTGHIFRSNMLIWFAYFVLFLITVKSSASYRGFGDQLLMYYLYAYLIHAGILILLGIALLTKRRAAEGGMYIMTGIIIPIIGFGACAAAFMSNLLGAGYGFF
jgi:hypothetical protein